MKKFDVEITETLQRKVSVEAASQEDAERMVTQAWNNQDYVLDSGDFTGVDFKTVGEHELAETRTMNVLLVQPNAYPKKISVGTELEDLQAMVGGDIEVTYPFEDEVAIILNGKRVKHTVKPVLGERAAHNGKVVYSLDFEVTPHLLRHTYITNLIHASVDPKTVQYLAGHENSKITMDIYAKAKYNRPDELAGILEDTFTLWDAE